MKRVVAIALSLLVFFQSAGWGMNDLFLLGRLIEHAEYHSENYGEDFLTFFEKHYGVLKAEHQKKHKEEQQEHEELPFQHLSCHHLLTDVVITPFDLDLKRAEVAIQKQHRFFYQNLYSSLEKVSIFQPPKAA
jgi:hypothetical protein